MDKYTAAEEGFKRGYEKGYEAGKPKWIPVSERCPDDRAAVICWVSGSVSAYHKILRFANYLEDVSCDFEGQERGGFYAYDSEYGYYEVTSVTHWMPLPEAPKVNK